jgi:hypothetical protein
MGALRAGRPRPRRRSARDRLGAGRSSGLVGEPTAWDVPR